MDERKTFSMKVFLFVVCAWKSFSEYRSMSNGKRGREVSSGSVIHEKCCQKCNEVMLTYNDKLPLELTLIFSMLCILELPSDVITCFFSESWRRDTTVLEAHCFTPVFNSSSYCTLGCESFNGSAAALTRAVLEVSLLLSIVLGRRGWQVTFNLFSECDGEMGGKILWKTRGSFPRWK